MNNENGRVYNSVPLIDELPINPGEPEGMLQAMPSRLDIEQSKGGRGFGRLAAGFEILLSHWRYRGTRIKNLTDQLDAQRKIVNADDAFVVAMYDATTGKHRVEDAVPTRNACMDARKAAEQVDKEVKDGKD